MLFNRYQVLQKAQLSFVSIILYKQLPHNGHFRCPIGPRDGTCRKSVALLCVNATTVDVCLFYDCGKSGVPISVNLFCGIKF